MIYEGIGAPKYDGGYETGMSEKMNIILISSLAPPYGGLTTWSAEYLDACQDEPVNVFCVNTNYVGKKAIIQGKRNVIYEIKRSFRIWKKLKSACDSETIDVVHLSSPCSLYGNLRDIITYRIAKRKAPGAKMILHCHCDLTYFVGESKLKKYVFTKLIHCVDKVFVMNSQSQKYIDALTSDSKTAYIPNFLTHVPIEGDDADVDGKLHVLFLGRQTKLKGIDTFVAVASKAYKEFGDRIVFDIVGDEPDSTIVESYSPNVAIYGPQTHTKALEYMSKSDVLIFPSHTEGFPYVILEAMMYKTAIIASNVGAIADMLENTEAVVINGWDEDDYYKALKQIYLDNSSKKIGEKEYLKYENEFTPRIVIHKIIEQYEH